MKTYDYLPAHYPMKYLECFTKKLSVMCVCGEKWPCSHFIPPPKREIIEFKDKTNDPLNSLKDRITQYIKHWKKKEQTKDICYMIFQLQHLERAIEGYQDYWRISLEEAERIIKDNKIK